MSLVDPCTSRRTSRRAWLAACAAAALACACRRSTPAARGNVVLGVSALRISLPLFVALERGLFRARGLAIELRPYVTAQPMVDDVVAGRLDAAGFAAYPIVLASSRGAVEPPRVVTSLVEDDAHRLSYVLARARSGIRFPEGLRGKRVGILPTVAYQRWLGAILRASGVREDEVTVVPLQPAVQVATLVDGGVDVLFTGDPMATAALARDDVVIVDDGPPCARRLGAPFAFGTFVLGGRLARERPADAELVVSALDEAILAVRADPVAARRAMAAHVRPEERGLVERYPDTRHLTSGETPPGWLAREVERERELGIFSGEATAVAWGRTS